MKVRITKVVTSSFQVLAGVHWWSTWCHSCLSILRENPNQSVGNSPTLVSKMLRATTVADHSAYIKTIKRVTWYFGQCSGLLGATIKVTTLQDHGKIEVHNTSAGQGSREQQWQLRQMKNRTWVYLNICYQLAEWKWVIVWLDGFGLLLAELLDLRVAGSQSPSSSHIWSWRLKLMQT